MKKLLIILIVFVSVANNAQAQTKEETITWLRDKLQKYYLDEKKNLSSIDVTECYITIRYKRDNSSIYRQWEYKIIPTANVILNKTNDGFDMKIKDDVQSIRRKFFDEGETLSEHGISIINGEENLFERLQKAITHLATFCPKTTETF